VSPPPADRPGLAVVWHRPTSPLLDHPLLSAPERERLDRLAVPWARTRHVTGRVLARAVAAALLDASPADVELATTARGAGVVAGQDDLRLSISHTHGMVVAAAMVRRRVGIDVERTDRDGLPAPHLWQAPAERAVHRTRAAAVRLWVAKEAVAKATGAGLGHPLGTIRVDGAEARTPRAAWLLVDVPTQAGWTTVVAHRGRTSSAAPGDDVQPLVFAWHLDPAAVGRPHPAG
jgi:4'-phosphopantetheinyl transferase